MQHNNVHPIPDYVLDAVRSTGGVRYAVPLYSGGVPMLYTT